VYTVNIRGLRGLGVGLVVVVATAAPGCREARAPGRSDGIAAMEYVTPDWQRARACCDCVDGIWSSTGDCALARAQVPTYQDCAADSGHESAYREADSIVRDPFRFFARPAGERDALLEICGALAEEHPDDLAVSANLGKFLYYARDLERAEQVLSATAEDPRLADVPRRAQEVYEHLGLTYKEQGRLDLAEEALLRNIEFWDEMPAEAAYYRGCPFERLGDLYGRTGQEALAAEYHRLAAEVDLHTPAGFLDVAVLQFRAGRYEATNRALETVEWRLSSMRYEKPETKTAADRLRARAAPLRGYVHIVQGHTVGANEAFDEALRLVPDEPGARVGHGHLAVIRRDYGTAEAAFIDVVGATGDRAEAATDEVGYERLVQQVALLGLAWAEVGQNRPEAAIRQYDRILDRDPEMTAARVGKARALVAVGRGDEAEVLADRVIEGDPDNVFALAELGIIALNQGDLTAAEARFQRAAELGGNEYSCPFEGLGLVYLRQGRIDAARESFETAVEIAPDVEHVKYNELARIHMASGDHDRAEALLRASLDNAPHDPEAAGLLAELEQLRQSGAEGTGDGD